MNVRPNKPIGYLVIGLVTMLIAWTSLVYASDFLGITSSYKIKKDEKLLDIARRFNLGYVEMIAANPSVDAWLPETGTVIQLPTQHTIPKAPKRGIVINLGDFRLYWFSTLNNKVDSWPIAIARKGFSTPLGKTEVVKLASPVQPSRLLESANMLKPNGG